MLPKLFSHVILNSPRELYNLLKAFRQRCKATPPWGDSWSPRCTLPEAAEPGPIPPFGFRESLTPSWSPRGLWSSARSPVSWCFPPAVIRHGQLLLPDDGEAVKQAQAIARVPPHHPGRGAPLPVVAPRCALSPHPASSPSERQVRSSLPLVFKTIHEVEECK